VLKRILLILLLTYFGGSLTAQNGEQEANLKAAFIYNFTKYVDWQTNKYDNIFVIGVIGDASIIPPLKEIARSNTVNNKRIVVRVFKRPAEITDCNILFIPRNTPYSLQSILRNVGKGVLTISEHPGYAEEGTGFNFVILNNKLKFEANVNALNASGVKAGSQLLKLAIIVDKNL